MWIPFFKNENAGNVAIPDIHTEKTQWINPKPPVEELEEGYLCCSNCGEEIDLADYKPLSISTCPHCEAPNFIPMKVKNYWLHEPLGGGGMGSVYRAFYDQDPDMEMAVKILPREKKTDTYLIESLLKEAQIGYEFGEHPHLARVYDYGLDGDEYFEALEYVDGVRLDQIIDSPVKRPMKQVLLWAMQILAAEQHMFETGYLFRDLKPQNIIIDENGNAVLIDYGLAISLEDAVNNSSDKIQGSPYYIPPERIVGAGESLCSEIYSLGMVLFHVLAGQTYYSAAELKKLVGKHVNSLRINNVASKLPGGMPPEFIKVLNKMINRTPRQRYQTYKEVAAAIFKVYQECA